MPKILHIKSISELHKFLGYSPPKHPAISLIRFSEINLDIEFNFEGGTTDFYIVSLKESAGQLKYGREYYDFEEGTLTFSSPNQVVYPSHLIADIQDDAGWSLIFHPDLLFGTRLFQTIDTYKFFSYDVHEALHISDIEKKKITECIQNILDECNQNIDHHSQELIVSNLELLLNYCKRFYDRQFLTRRKQSSNVVSALENILKTYFDSDTLPPLVCQP